MNIIFFLTLNYLFLDDQNLVNAFRASGNNQNLKDVWLNMFQLMGNPAHFLRHCRIIYFY